MKTKNIFLYVLVSLIWGTTWLVIKYQIQNTGAVSGVFYRFLAASIIFFCINLLLKKNIWYPIKTHKFFIIQGIFNYSINYILTYVSESYINSGLVALTFTTLIYYNMIGLKFFYKKNIETNAILGTIIGGIGIFLIFYNEIIRSTYDKLTIQGIIIGLIATISASLGNMASIKNHQAQVPVIVFNAWSMLYGALFSLIVGIVLKQSFAFNPNFNFYSSLTYLTIFGTVIAFYGYQTLIIEIGAHKAAYSSIISPMIAVCVSMYFEGFKISPNLLIGIFLAVLGNILVLTKFNLKERL